MDYKTNKKSFNFTKRLLKWLDKNKSLNSQDHWDKTVDFLRTNPTHTSPVRDVKPLHGDYKDYHSCKVGLNADRVIYKIDNKSKIIYFVFIGTHGEYDKYLKEDF